jgi:hypothetical protein
MDRRTSWCCMGTRILISTKGMGEVVPLRVERSGQDV